MKLTTIYEGSLFDCQMVKQMLESEGLNAVLKDEVIGTRAHAWVPTSTVKVQVNDNDTDTANVIVIEFKKSRDKNS